MRYYLDFPLVAGYVLMATTACLGMLQFAAARGGYAGLSLFSADRRKGIRIGSGLTVVSLIAYVSFAPEILTPGPAGTEVALIFSACALLALFITLAGADRRIHRERTKMGAERDSLVPDFPEVISHKAPSPSPTQHSGRADRTPAVVLLSDPTGLVTASIDLIDALRDKGIVVMRVEASQMTEPNVRHWGAVLLEHISAALPKGLSHLMAQPGIDRERVGLLGLGLGGDLALASAARDSGFKAIMAVSPVAVTVSRSPGFGLEWLHELGYRHAWCLRRRWSSFRSAAMQLNPNHSAVANLPVPSAVLYGADSIMTTRSPSGAFELLSVASGLHFTVLREKHARRTLVQWFERRLTR